MYLFDSFKFDFLTRNIFQHFRWHTFLDELETNCSSIHLNLNFFSLAQINNDSIFLSSQLYLWATISSQSALLLVTLASSLILKCHSQTNSTPCLRLVIFISETSVLSYLSSPFTTLDSHQRQEKNRVNLSSPAHFLQTKLLHMPKKSRVYLTFSPHFFQTRLLLWFYPTPKEKSSLPHFFTFSQSFANGNRKVDSISLFQRIYIRLDFYQRQGKSRVSYYFQTRLLQGQEMTHDLLFCL